MVTLDKIRQDMKSRLDIDKDLHHVDVNADTIDEALADAAVQLDTKVANLQYETQNLAQIVREALFFLKPRLRAVKVDAAMLPAGDAVL